MDCGYVSSQLHRPVLDRVGCCTRLIWDYSHVCRFSTCGSANAATRCSSVTFWAVQTTLPSHPTWSGRQLHVRIVTLIRQLILHVSLKIDGVKSGGPVAVTILRTLRQATLWVWSSPWKQAFPVFVFPEGVNASGRTPRSQPARLTQMARKWCPNAVTLF